MLERYSIAFPKEDVSERFGIEVTDAYKQRYNASPTQLMPVIANDCPDGVSFFYWGTTPKWSNQKAVSEKIHSVMAEQLPYKASFLNALRTRRCLILSDGYFLWKKLGKKLQVPHRIVLKSRGLFAMAGLWEEYEEEEENKNEMIHTFRIITTEACNDIKRVADRMPAILTPETEKIWLSDTTDESVLTPILKPYSEGPMESYTVSSSIKKVDFDNPVLLQPRPAADQFGNYTLFS